MRKITIFLSLLFGALGVNAQEQEVMLTMTAEAGGSFDVDVYCASAGQTISVDWGDGELQTYNNIASDQEVDWATKIEGTIKGDGLVKFYGTASELVTFESIYSANGGAKVTAIDLSQTTNLTKLTMQTHALSEIDLKPLTKLTSLTLSNNRLTAIDLSANTLLSSLKIDGNQLTKADLTGLDKVSTLLISNNPITELTLPEGGALKTLTALNLSISGALDLTKFPALATVNVSGAQLTSIDASGMELTSLFCQNNRLTELKVGTVKTTLNCSGNCLSLDALPVKGSTKNFTYAPQDEYVLPESIDAGGNIDLSAMASLQGVLEEAAPSTFTWKYAADSSVVDASKYTAADGVFTFPEAMDSIFCEISTTAFPDFAGNNAFTTTPVLVKEKGEPMLTLTADAGGSFDVDVYCASAGQTISVDWGDGQLQTYNNIASDQEVDWATKIEGTIKGDGLVKFYGTASELVTFESIYSANGGAKVTAIDLSQTTNLTKLTMQTHALSEIDLKPLTKLTSLTLSNNRLTAIDLSANTLLSSLKIDGNQLTKADLTGLDKVSTLLISNNPITELTLPEGGALKTLTALNLSISGALDLTKFPALATVNVSGAQLTSIDASGMELTSLFCQNNRLTELKVGTVKTTLNCSGNCLSLDALPVKGSTKNFTYAPQDEYVLPESIDAGGNIDLSAMASLQGVLEEAAPSTFTWKYAADSSVVDASKYTAADGVFTFPEAMDSIFCEISTTAFPAFADNNAFTTTPVLVKASSAVPSIQEHTVQVTASDGCITVTNVPAGTEVRIYNTAGQLLAAKIADGNVVFSGLAKGIYFVNAGSEKIKVGLN